MDSSYSGNSSNWSFTSSGHTSSDIQQIQDLKLQNEQLQKVISQLRASIERTDGQLKTALASASSSMCLREEIASLKKKMKENKEEATKKESSYKNKIEELTKSFKDSEEKNTEIVVSHSKEIQKLNQTLKETKMERNMLADEVIQVKGDLEFALGKVAKINKQKQNAKKKCAEIAQKWAEETKKYDSLVLFHEQISLENKNREEQIEELNSQISQMNVEIMSLKDKLSNAQREISNSNNAINDLEQQYEMQKEELNQFSDERDKLIQLIQKLHSAICFCEEEIETKNAENEQLREKSKKLFVPNMFLDQFNIKDVAFPFQEDLKKRVDTILGYEQFQSQQKMQLIINEVAKEISKLNNDVSSTSEDAKKKEEESAAAKIESQKAFELLQFILREWKCLECNENFIDTVAFCDKDKAFLNLIAEQCTKCESLPKESSNSMFISSSILSDEGSEERKKLIDEVAEKEKSLSSLLSAVFLMNLRLKKQVSQLIGANEHKETVEATLNALGVDNIGSVSSYVESLLEKIDHLKNSRKEIHVALVSARDALIEKDKIEENLNNEVDTLKQQVDSLTSDNNSLQKQLEEVSENRSITPPSSPSVRSQSSPSVVSQSSSCSDYETKALKEMQQVIINKTKENEELRIQFQELEKIQENKERKHQKVENFLKKHISDLEDALTQTCDTLTKTKKKAKNSIVATKEQANAEIASIKDSLEKEKEDVQKELCNANEKTEKLDASIKHLQEVLDATEKKKNELMEDNTRIKNSLRQIESNMRNIQDKYIREQKTAQSELAVKMFNIEAQHKKENKELKAKYEAEKQKSVEFFTSHLEALYGFKDIDTDESSIIQIFNRLQSDLSKLKFFQMQATKY